MSESNNYKLSIDERETIMRIGESEGEDLWLVDTSIKKDMTNFINKGWEVVSKYLYPDGTTKAMVFKAPRNCVSYRNCEAVKNRKGKPMSEEHKIKLQEGRNNKSKNT